MHQVMWGSYHTTITVFLNWHACIHLLSASTPLFLINCGLVLWILLCASLFSYMAHVASLDCYWSLRLFHCWILGICRGSVYISWSFHSASIVKADDDAACRSYWMRHIPQCLTLTELQMPGVKLSRHLHKGIHHEAQYPHAKLDR